jgi:hypothetical protein
MWTLPLVRGDRFVLCSDGLVDEVPDDEILDLVMTIDDPQQLSDRLVAAANSHGGRDNVTVIVVDVLDGIDPPDATDELAFDPTWAENLPSEPTVAVPIGAAAEDGMAAGDPARNPSDDASAESVPTIATDELPEPPAIDAMSLPTLPPPPLPVLTSALPAGAMPPSPTLEDMRPLGESDGTTDGNTDATTAMPGTAADEVAAASAIAAPIRVDPAVAASGPAPVTARKRRRFGVGAFLFVFVLAAIVIAAFTLIAVHARSGYFVGFNGDKVVVYKGQKDQILWFKPTVQETSSKSRGDLDPTMIAVIDKRPPFDSADAAASFIENDVTATTLPTVDTTPATAVATTTSTTTTTSEGATTTTTGGP